MKDPRLDLLAEQIYQLGPQPLAYLLSDIEARASIRPLLEKYAALPAEFIRDMGADRIARRFVVIAGGRNE